MEFKYNYDLFEEDIARIFLVFLQRIIYNYLDRKNQMQKM